MTLIDCQLLAIVDVVKSCQSTDTQTLNAVLTPTEWTRAHLSNIRHRSTTADIQAALSVVWSFTLLARLGVTLDTNTLTLYNLVDTATSYCLHTNYSYTIIPLLIATDFFEIKYSYSQFLAYLLSSKYLRVCLFCMWPKRRVVRRRKKPRKFGTQTRTDNV